MKDCMKTEIPQERGMKILRISEDPLVPLEYIELVYKERWEANGQKR